jgi:hypothetical protein
MFWMRRDFTILAGSERPIHVWSGRFEPGRATAPGANATTVASHLGSPTPIQFCPHAAAWGAWMGAWTGAFASRDSHEVTFGGLAGANLGALAGYGLVKTDLVDPRDFGWLSLAGALGTALGGGVGAALSSKDDPRPILAGVAAGPLLGLATGAVLVPRLRSSGESHSMFVAGRKVAGVSLRLSDSTTGSDRAPRTSADVLAGAKPSRIKNALRPFRNLFDVASWSPMVGALPQDPGTPGETPFLLGVTGTLR